MRDPRAIGTGPLYRAVAVGFMANNLFPLRMGEVVRAWYLARETGVSTAALFGTVILERVIDTVAVIALAFCGLFESAAQLLLAAWLTLAAIGVAVALPSAPGFFGPYQLACRLALEPFGVDDATAVALGILFNVVFWVTLTALGLAALRGRRTSLAEIEHAAERPPGAPPA